MSLKKTAVLAVVLVAILLYIFRVLEPGKEAEKQAKFIFRELAQDKISSLHVVSSKGEYTLEQIASTQAAPTTGSTGTPGATTLPSIKSSTWRLQGFEKAPLDQAKLSSLLMAITNLTSDDVIEASDIDSDKSVYGLDKPELTLEIKSAAKNQTIKFGKENTYTGKRYVSIEPDGPALMLAPDTLLQTAAIKADDIKSRMPLQFADSDVKSLEIKAGKDLVKLARAEDGSGWNLVEPIQAKAAQPTIQQLLRDLKNLRTEEFIERNPQTVSANGLGNAAVEVNLEFQKDRPGLNLKIAPTKPTEDSKPAFFIVDEQPAVYKLNNFDRASIVKSVIDLRDREMFTFERNKVESVSFQLGQDSSSLHKIEKSSDGKWSVDGKPADSTFVGELLGNLNSLKATDFSPASAQAFEKPQLKIILGLGETKQQTLTVGTETKLDSKLFYARSTTRTEDFVISAETLKLITPKVEVLAAVPTPTASSAAVSEPQAAGGNVAPEQPAGGASG